MPPFPTKHQGVNVEGSGLQVGCRVQDRLAQLSVCDGFCIIQLLNCLCLTFKRSLVAVAIAIVAVSRSRSRSHRRGGGGSSSSSSSSSSKVEGLGVKALEAARSGA